MTKNDEPGFAFEGTELLASALHAQLLARRRSTLEHDLKNVVHGLLSGAELLGKSLATASPRISAAECLLLLQQQLARSQATMNRLLDEVAPLDVAIGAIGLYDLVNECTHALRHQLQMLNLEASIAPALTVRGHRTRLKNVLLCVLLDCVDAAPARSNLILIASRSDTKALVRLQHVQDAAKARSSVMPFIGELLKADDALLELDSAPTQRTITISLPLAPAQPIERSNATRLLIVDANRDAADSLAMLVQLEGFDAVAVYDCDAAFQSARATPPVAVLVDLDGSIDSATLIRKLRTEPASQMRIVGLSHSIDARSPTGVDAQLRKPLDPAALQSLLAQDE